MKINRKFDVVGTNLPRARGLVRDLAQSTRLLVRVAVSDIKPAVVVYLSGIDTLETYVDTAKSIDELHSASKSDPKLKAALSSLRSSGVQIESWQTANC